MALRISDEDYEKNNPDLNPGQADYNEEFNDLNQAEKNGNYETNRDPATNKFNGEENLKSAEENSGAEWANNVSGKATNTQRGKNKIKTNGKFGFLRKKGPLTTIILTVIGGGLGIGGLLSPGLLIINLKEVMVNKFNTQLASMDVRTTKMLKSKTLSSFGVCTATINIRCKYSSMSDRQIKNFEKAGIKVNYDEKNVIGRAKPTSFEFEGKKIQANELISESSINVKFRSAIKKGYNPLFAGFADKFWNKTILKIGISKKGIKFTKGDDDVKFKDIQERTKNPASNISNKTKIPTEDDIDPDTNKPYTKEAIQEATDAAEKAAQELGEEIGDGAAEIVESGTKASTKVIAKAAGNVFKITGVLDNACMAYGTIRAVGFAAKVVRAAQLARYAMIFLNIADQIKAGANPDPADIGYLGRILTTEVASTVATQGAIGSVVRGKSATESFGYKYAAYGQKDVMPDTAAQFLAGGGLTGSLITVTSVINNILGGSPQATCKTLNNGFVQIGSAVAGIALAIFSGGVSISVQAVAQGIGAAALGLAIAYLPALLQDIVAGVVVDKNTVGELAGDAITSGSSGLMAATAATGGNTPLTPEQAVAYNNLSNNIAAQYAEEDRLAYSPFDISNKNTFMGSILFSLTPMISKMSSLSLSSSLMSVASLLSGSLSYLNPITKAADISDYTMCQDEDYKDLGLAADPFCNLVYGIPADALQNIEPLTVLDTLIDAGDIDPNTGAATGKYAEFITECSERKDPIGYTGDDFQGDKGDSCLISDSNTKYPRAKYYYLYQVDQRVENGMDGTDELLNAAEESGMNANISFYDEDTDSYATTADDISTITNINITNKPLQQAVNSQSIQQFNTTLTTSQTQNICNPSSINGRITDFSYLCGRSTFNLSKTGMTVL